MPNGRRRRRFCAEALYVRVLLDTAGWYCGVLAVPCILRPLIQQLLAYAFVDHSSLSTDVVKFPPAHSTTQYKAFTSVRFHNNKQKKKDEFANQSASNARLSIYTRHQQPPCRPSCSSDKPYVRAPPSSILNRTDHVPPPTDSTGPFPCDAHGNVQTHGGCCCRCGGGRARRRCSCGDVGSGRR
jgi:hypothetical protein